MVDSADARFTSGVVNDGNWFQSAEGADKFSFNGRPEIAFLAATADFPTGSTDVPVADTKAYSVGDLVVVGETFVTTIARTEPKKLVLAAPYPLAGVKERTTVFRFLTTAETTIATDALSSSQFVQVADEGMLFDGCRIVIGDTDYHMVTEIKGKVARVFPNLHRDRATGTKIRFLDPAVHSTLRENHPAGATVLKVFAGQRQKFKAKMKVRIDFDDPVEVADVGEDTVTLAKPTPRVYPIGSQVGVTADRKLFWGMYHAMFVSIFLTDAMRKSGFA